MKGLVLAFVVQMLRDYPPVRPKLVALLDHSSVEVQGAAIRALGSYEPVRARLIAALGPGVHIMQEPDADMGQAIHATNALRTLRSAAADALKDVPDLRTEFRALLANTDKEVREAAIHAVSADRSPEALLLLRERLGLEEEASLRFRILQALRRDPASVRPLCDRLQNDNKRAIRKAAAYALGQGDLSSAYPLRGLPSVARVVGTLCCADVPGLEALINFLKLPRRLDMDAELELGEDVLAWLCARLTWAYEVGYTADGQILGEVERSVARISSPGGLLVIRVAMDAFDLPRERFLRPNHNLMEVWEIARHLVALDPPTMVLACGDVVFEHLQPPSLNPGEVRFGPTFFGFRISRSDMSGADGETGRAVNIHKARSSEPPGA